MLPCCKEIKEQVNRMHHESQEKTKRGHRAGKDKKIKTEKESSFSSAQGPVIPFKDHSSVRTPPHDPRTSSPQGRQAQADGTHRGDSAWLSGMFPIYPLERQRRCSGAWGSG